MFFLEKTKKENIVERISFVNGAQSVIYCGIFFVLVSNFYDEIEIFFIIILLSIIIKMSKLKSKQSILHLISINSCIILISILIFTSSFFIFFPTKTSSISRNYRLKRQISSINDKQHDTNMLRRILLHRKNSSVFTDCTINMAIDGIYRRPLENSFPSKIIHLIEQSFENEIHSLKYMATKIRMNLSRQLSNSMHEDYLEKFLNEFNFDLRLLLASQIRIKNIDVRIISDDDNIQSYSIKYSRMNNSISSIIDYEQISGYIIKQKTILQTFTISNVRETLKNDRFNTNGWWLGPVLCEKNKNETFITAYILPVTSR